MPTERKNNFIKPFVTDNTNAEAYWMFDILWVIKAAGKQTNNEFSLIEQTMPYNSGPPPHLHPDMDETFYVLEGEITIWIAGEIYILKPGSLGWIPRNTVHYFKITSENNCEALNIYTPSGFEEGIIRNATKADSLTLPPKGLKFTGKDDMHVAVDIEPVDLINL